MNNKKIILLLATILMGLGLTTFSAVPAYASVPYVDSDGIVRDYGQTNNGINLHQPLDRDVLSHTTALKQGAWHVYADPHFSKQDVKVAKYLHKCLLNGNYYHEKTKPVIY